MSDELKPLMRRVYVDYTNRVGPRVNLTNQEMRVLQDADWFDVLKIPRVRYHLRANTPFQPQVGQDHAQVFDIVRTHAGHRLEDLPTKWGPMQLVGVTWKRSNDATVRSQGFHAIRKDVVSPIKDIEAHLKSNETRSQTVLFSRNQQDIKPFPVDEYKGVGLLHLIMQLPALRDWLWTQAPVRSITIHRPARHSHEQPSDLTDDASRLWAGRAPLDKASKLAQAVETVRSQQRLADLVRMYKVQQQGLNEQEARVFRRATEVELQRRELRDLARAWDQTLFEARTPAKQYNALLLCHRQVCQPFVDLDWEADSDLRDFTRKVEQALNDPRFVKQWQPVSLADVQDSELDNSMTRALHIVNADRTAKRTTPVKLRWPVPHEVFKTWVALQKMYGPADDFPSPSDFGLRLSAEQRQLRNQVWSQFDDRVALDNQSPQAKYEVRRLQPAINTLKNFNSGQYSREQVLDAVRRCPRMRLLVDDILKAIA
jgi:hypothetical protein